ncbi:MAG TPA: hypothetical protein VNQ90_15630 [Chthoniobacteraceae bacterium]|nr:hypothetical protein [Chthoniobacteraceae bacterium]
MANAFYDGDFTVAQPQGPDVISFDPELRCHFLRRTMRQRAASFEKMGIGVSIATDFYLYKETEGRNVGADLLEWDRLAMELPPPRIMPEGYVHSYQFLSLGDEPIVEAQIPVTSHVYYSYSHVEDPTTIETLSARRYILIGSVVYRVGDLNVIESGPDEGWFLAEDSVIRNIRGNVWEHAKRYVPPFDPTMVT